MSRTAQDNASESRPPASNGQSRQSPHERILASAGSGKTWQLSNRYLRLIRAGAAPESILASTFTRLAAGEIRERIFDRLTCAADSDAEREQLAEQALGTGSVSRDDVLALMCRLARRIHLMNIRTLDSFFASIVGSFPFELNIPPGCRIVDADEGSVLRAEAVRRMLNEREPQQLIETLRLLTRGEPVSAISRTIDQVIVDLYEISRDSLGHAWDWLPELPVLEAPHVAVLIEELLTLAPPSGSGIVWFKAHARACVALRDHNWIAFLGSGIAKAVAAGRRSFNRKSIPDDLLGAYKPLVDHAFAFVINQYGARNRATRDMLRLYTKNFESIKRDWRVLEYSDLTRALLTRAGEAADGRIESRLGALEEIAYRLDRSLEHVLLDEFQDTSIAQWNALHPLFHELVSDETTGRTFFCVGDLKQSIYEWRDATPEILERLPELLFGAGAGEEQLASRPLDVSYRSAPAVIDAINAIFHDLEQNPALAEHAVAAEHWSRSFHPHEVAEKHRDLPGFFELLAVARSSAGDDESDDEYDDERDVGDDGSAVEIDADLSPALLSAIERARSLLAACGNMTIGIITRTNAKANLILHHLQREGLPVSGPGGGALSDVAAVNALLDLLQLAEAPNDTAAAFHIANSPLGAAVAFSEWDRQGARNAFARSIRAEIVERGFAPLLARLAPALAPACGAREFDRVLRLVDLAESVDATGSRDIGAFITIVEQRVVADVMPAPIQVLTIHRAKGLEYDAVILPELGWSVTGIGPAKYAYERDGLVGPIVRITRQLRKDPDVRSVLRDHGCDVEAFFAHAQFRRVRESLSMLYVALTRARRALYLIVEAPKLKKDGKPYKGAVESAGGLIWSALHKGDDPPLPGEVIATFGDDAWFASLPAEGARTRDRARPEPPLPEQPVPPVSGDRDQQPSGARIRRRLAAREAAASASRLASADRLRDRLDWPQRDAADQGTAIHAMFETIEWLEEFELDDASLTTRVRALLPRRASAWIDRCVASFRRALEQESVRTLLSRPVTAKTADTTVRLWRERPYARLTDEGIERGVIDRLVIESGGNGIATAAHIIDFKTGRRGDESVGGPSNVDHYRPQLQAYRTVVAAMYGIDPARIRATLLFTFDGSMHEV